MNKEEFDAEVQRIVNFLLSKSEIEKKEEPPRKCENCRYHFKNRCRRYPPIYNGRYYFQFPEVESYWSCGEWRKQ